MKLTGMYSIHMEYKLDIKNNEHKMKRSISLTKYLYIVWKAIVYTWVRCIQLNLPDKAIKWRGWFQSLTHTYRIMGYLKEENAANTHKSRCFGFSFSFFLWIYLKFSSEQCRSNRLVSSYVILLLLRKILALMGNCRFEHALSSYWYRPTIDETILRTSKKLKFKIVLGIFSFIEKTD